MGGAELVVAISRAAGNSGADPPHTATASVFLMEVVPSAVVLPAGSADQGPED